MVTLDGDHSYPVDALSYLQDRQVMSFKHRLGNLLLSLSMSLLFFHWVRDSQSGLWVDLDLLAEGHAVVLQLHQRQNSPREVIRNLAFLFKKRFFR